jgi:hypothetical protein
MVLIMIKSEVKKTLLKTFAASLTLLLLAGCGQSGESTGNDAKKSVELLLKACQSYELALESTIDTAPPHFIDAIDFTREARQSAASKEDEKYFADFESRLEKAMELAKNPVGREDEFVELVGDLSSACDSNQSAAYLILQ